MRENHEREERAGKCSRIETKGTVIEEKRQEKSCPDEQGCAHHNVQAKGPPAMSFEVSGQRVTQCHDGAEHDEDGHEAASQVLNKVAHAPTNPRHIQAGKADGESSHDVNTPIPAMKGRCALPDLRNKLNQSREDYDDG